jgi:hypothetical protein
MSIIKRLSDIWKSTKPEEKAAPVNPFEETSLMDIVSVDLEEYVVSGKAVFFDRGFPPHRFAYYLQNGAQLSCLVIDKGRNYECFICEFVEGSLDDPQDVPTELDVNGEVTYKLENQRTDMVRTEGNTDFRSNDEVIVWKYFAEGDKFFFLQWQDGKFVALEGMKTPASSIKFMKSAK